MKFFSNFKNVVILSFLSLVFSSCEENENTVHPDFREGTILKTAYQDPNLTTFVDALLVTNLSELLLKNEPYTVFAPTNEAFSRYLIKANYASLGKVPVGILKQLLLNHIVLGNLKSSSITDGYLKTLAKSSISQNNTMSLHVNTSSGVKLNGLAMVTTPDIKATNGTIHIVNEVIDFPMINNHLDLIAKLSEMNIFMKNNAGTALLNQITLPNFYEKNKQQFFDPIVPISIFAPTNEAFAALNVELASSGGIAGISTTNLNKILSYHAVSKNMLSTSWINNQVIPSLILLAPPVTPETVGTYESFTIQLSNNKTIKDSRNRVATIETTDIQCWNGVIHIVNKVILPNF